MSFLNRAGTEFLLQGQQSGPVLDEINAQHKAVLELEHMFRKLR